MALVIVYLKNVRSAYTVRVCVRVQIWFEPVVKHGRGWGVGGGVGVRETLGSLSRLFGQCVHAGRTVHKNNKSQSHTVRKVFCGFRCM